MTAVDDWVERVGRSAAGRLTRRSFLGRAGKLAVMVAGGPALAVVLAEEAEARVCGQTGVSPLCPSFDCDGVWGWCWYATGCCAGGMLKKICDCCALDWPNVHGYCPPGTNVKCIVESCGTDPRVQRAAIARLATDDPVEMADLVHQIRHSHRVSEAVVTDAAVPVMQAIAAPVGALVAGPVVPLDRHAPLAAGLVHRLRNLGVGGVRVVGPQLPASLDSDLATAGFTVERVGSSGDVTEFSGEVASWVDHHRGRHPRVVLDPALASGDTLAAAAAFAASLRLALVVGGGAAGDGGAYLLGPDAGGGARGPLVDPVGVATTDPVTMATELARLAASAEGPGHSAVLAPVGCPALLPLAGLGRPLLLHAPRALDGAREWLLEYGGAVDQVWLAGGAGALADDGYRQLQSLLNGFEAELLVGVGGQGLPVYDQPDAERPVGNARLGTDPPPARRSPPRRPPPPPARRRPLRPRPRRVLLRRRRR